MGWQHELAKSLDPYLHMKQVPCKDHDGGWLMRSARFGPTRRVHLNIKCGSVARTAAPAGTSITGAHRERLAQHARMSEVENSACAVALEPHEMADPSGRWAAHVAPFESLGLLLIIFRLAAIARRGVLSRGHRRPDHRRAVAF